MNQFNCSKNQIAALPPLPLTLSNLNISFNKINVIDDNITKLTSLTHLYIDNNDFASLPTSLQNLKNLTELSLE